MSHVRASLRSSGGNWYRGTFPTNDIKIELSNLSGDEPRVEIQFSQKFGNYDRLKLTVPVALIRKVVGLA